MNNQRETQLRRIADRIFMDLSFTAPEDIEMMKVKILNGLLTVDLPLQEIHHIMDGKMWDTDTFQDIAEILTEAGFVIKEPKE